MKISARNVLKGKVKSVMPGAVNSEVVVVLPGAQEIVSTITKASADNLQLHPDKDVLVVIKASNVLIAVEWTFQTAARHSESIFQACVICGNRNVAASFDAILARLNLRAWC